MYFAQHYLECLSQASYLIGDEATGQAVVVDPRRDIEEYLADAAAHGLRIVGVINTHFHADFLAGHLEIAESTGAWIGYGAVAQTEYASRSLVDGESIVFAVDNAEFVVDAGNIDKARLVPDWIALGLAPAVDNSGRDARPGKQKKTPGQKPGAQLSTEKSSTNQAANEPSDPASTS